MDEEELEVRLGRRLVERGLTVATAESCTGGGVAARLTSVPGSSAYVRGGVVAYASEVKTRLLGVPAQMIDTYNVVSREVAVAMARGVQTRLGADCAVATTGIAGPDGGTRERPVGIIWIAAAVGTEIRTLQLNGDSGRRANTDRAITSALQLLYEMLA